MTTDHSSLQDPMYRPGGTDNWDGLPKAARWRAMLTVITGIGMCVIDASMVTVALPDIVRDLAVSEREAISLINAYQLAVLVLLLPLSVVGDLYGYRRVYLAGAALFACAGALSFFATGLLQLTLARVLLGTGAAGILAVNAALVRQIYPRRMLGAGIALNSAVVASASVAGPALATGILRLANWPWLFALSIPFAMLVLALGWRSLPTGPVCARNGMRLPWIDGLFNGAMFLLLFTGMQHLVPHGDKAATPGSAWALIGLGVLVGILYIRRQRRLAVPMLPVDLLSIPVFRLSICTSVAAFSAQTLASLALPFLLLETLGLRPSESGWILAFWPLGTVLVAPVAARLIGSVPSGLLGSVGLAMLAGGFAGLAALGQGASPVWFSGYLLLCGLGFGIFQSPNNHTIVTSAPTNRSGGAAGMLSTARLTGQATGSMLMGLLYGIWTAQSGYVPKISLVTAVVLSLSGCVSSLLRWKSQVGKSKGDAEY